MDVCRLYEGDYSLFLGGNSKKCGKDVVYNKFKVWWGPRISQMLKCSSVDPGKVVKPTFYWWLAAEEGFARAFLADVGQLVKHHGKYVVVTGVYTTYPNSWVETQVFSEEDGRFMEMLRPKSPEGWSYRDSNGAEAWDGFGEFEPSDIPQEVLDLACSKAMTCPMRG